jgi:hypothetical protein
MAVVKYLHNRVGVGRADDDASRTAELATGKQARFKLARVHTDGGTDRESIRRWSGNGRSGKGITGNVSDVRQFVMEKGVRTTIFYFIE